MKKINKKEHKTLKERLVDGRPMVRKRPKNKKQKARAMVNEIE